MAVKPPSASANPLLIQALDDAELGLVWVDAQGRLQHSNKRFAGWAGMPGTLDQCFPGLHTGAWSALLSRPAGQAQSLHLGLKTADGELLSTELRFHSLGENPAADALTVLSISPLGDAQLRSAIDLLQRDVLEAVALSRPLQVVMDLLCRRVESLAPDVICTVLAVDEQGRVHPLAAPSLPASFSAALDGVPIGPKAGSCGTAAWRREPVEVADIARDPLWEDYRVLALAYGLAACWSTPILRADQRVGATFALYYREPRPVVPFHRGMVEACAQLCQVALRNDEHLRQIERLAYYDNVTGLANRRLFADRARHDLLISSRQGSPTALLLLDVDRFKTINDSLGHAVGDEVLRQLAQRLGPCLRDSDTLARLGGDEFGVILQGSTAADAMHAADKLLAALQPPLDLPGQAPLSLSASIGIANFPEDGGDLESLLKNAEIAMYEAKRAGRNCARFFLHAMNEALGERLQMEAALRQALSQGCLQLHYQPKLRLADGRTMGCEALLRWRHPEWGPVAPDRFIGVAEECGLINALDAWVLEQACAQLARWQQAGVALPEVAVNVSPLRFYQDDVAAHVGQLLQQHGLRAEQLTLEVTERLMLDDNARTRGQMQRLHEMGVRISVDDFGTGYSSLGYLKRLPVSELKLDKSFVRDLETDPDDRALATAVIGIGRALGLTVVAEGVETAAQQQVLEQVGCDMVQGWRFGHPMPAEALEEWLRQRSTQAV